MRTDKPAATLLNGANATALNGATPQAEINS